MFCFVSVVQGAVVGRVHGGRCERLRNREGKLASICGINVSGAENGGEKGAPSNSRSPLLLTLNGLLCPSSDSGFW